MSIGGLMVDAQWLDATAQAELVERGEITPPELVGAAVERIEELNPVLNAVIHDLSAKALDEDTASPSGPFAGVPMLVKDGLLTTAGDPMHNGMQLLKDAGWTEPSDSWTARRFRDAGFRIIGKTNLPELATSVTTEPVAYGPTRNPWNLDHTPGGSSGGSAAAVAAGMVPVAHGTDMGGSIRFPASCCGVVGLMPSRGRGTLGPDFGEYWGPTTHEHVLTRTVRDSAAVLDAIRGPGVGDTFTAPPPDRPYAQEVGREPGRLRIGVLRDPIPASGFTRLHPDCLDALDATTRVLESLGHDVTEDHPEAVMDATVWGAMVMVMAGVARDIDRWSQRLGRTIELDELEPSNAAMVEMGRGVSATAYLESREHQERWVRDLAAWWADGNDILVMTTLPEPPPELGVIGSDPRLWLAHTGLFNPTAQPAVSLPLYWNAAGLPIGVQLVAAPWREDLLLRLAGQLEAAMPWSDRRPPLSSSADRLG